MNRPQRGSSSWAPQPALGHLVERLNGDRGDGETHIQATGCQHSPSEEVVALWAEVEKHGLEVAKCSCCRGPTATGRDPCLRCWEPVKEGAP